MMIPKNEDELEGYLRSFHPRSVAPLRRQRARATTVAWGFGFASVAAVAIFAIVTLRSPLPHKNPGQAESTAPPVSVMQFKAAADSDERLESVLAQTAQHTLPRTSQHNTALNALAKD